MTVSYAYKVATASKVGAFRKVMTTWRGSLYKLTKYDLLIYMLLYAIISLTYHHALNEKQKRNFEIIVTYCNNNRAMIPLTFVLAFYMNHVVQRWWETWKMIPWPFSIAIKVNTFLPGKDDDRRQIRRNVVRYICLSITETYRMLSVPVKKRFPTYQHLVDAGLLTNNEMEAVNCAKMHSEYLTTFYWMPMVWAGNLLKDAETKGLISERYVAELMNEIAKIRSICGDLISYDWISVPLIYSQLVTLAVYSYFAAALFGRQHLGKTHEFVDMGHQVSLVPLFLILEFSFFVGWLKAAECLLNPYGEDDDDFETNLLIDTNIQSCYLYVDTVGQNPPVAEKDPHWFIGVPDELPYTVASLPYRAGPLETTGELLRVPEADQMVVPSIESRNGSRTNLTASRSTSVTNRLRRASGISIHISNAINSFLGVISNGIRTPTGLSSRAVSLSSHTSQCDINHIGGHNKLDINQNNEDQSKPRRTSTVSVMGVAGPGYRKGSSFCLQQLERKRKNPTTVVHPEDIARALDSFSSNHQSIYHMEDVPEIVVTYEDQETP